MENIYNITRRKEDYENPTYDGEISWHNICLFDTNSEEVMEIWKNRLYKCSSRRCARCVEYILYIGTTMCEPQYFDRSGVVE